MVLNRKQLIYSLLVYSYSAYMTLFVWCQLCITSLQHSYHGRTTPIMWCQSCITLLQHSYRCNTLFSVNCVLQHSYWCTTGTPFVQCQLHKCNVITMLSLHNFNCTILLHHSVGAPHYRICIVSIVCTILLNIHVVTTDVLR